jgi:hypothetical protein
MKTSFPNISPIPGLLQRPGLDHDPIKPGMLATLLRHGEVEVMSYPIPAGAGALIDRHATLMVRTTIGDPTTLKEVPIKAEFTFIPCPTNTATGSNTNKRALVGLKRPN